MRILVACEFSGIVRNTFAKRGHHAVSCDLLRSRTPGNHIRGNVLDHLDEGWDLMIAHPPCTHLCVSGARWFPEKVKEQQEALDFVLALMNAPIHKICIENPIGIISTVVREPDQIIQPWMFGHGEVKATCLWLKNLPALVATNKVKGRSNRIHMMPGSRDQGLRRSITYEGIAEAMSEQWGSLSPRFKVGFGLETTVKRRNQPR